MLLILLSASRHQSEFSVSSVRFGASLARSSLCGQPVILLPLRQQPSLLPADLHHRPGALPTIVHQPAVSAHASHLLAAPAGLHVWTRRPLCLPFQPQHPSLQAPHASGLAGQRRLVQHHCRSPQPVPSPSSPPAPTQPHCCHGAQRWHLLQSAGVEI